MIEALKKETSSAELLKSYSSVNGGWYVENSGPLALRDASGKVVGKHSSRSIYNFREGFKMYDLSL